MRVILYWIYNNCYICMLWCCNMYILPVPITLAIGKFEILNTKFFIYICSKYFIYLAFINDDLLLLIMIFCFNILFAFVMISTWKTFNSLNSEFSLVNLHWIFSHIKIMFFKIRLQIVSFAVLNIIFINNSIILAQNSKHSHTFTFVLWQACSKS